MPAAIGLVDLGILLALALLIGLSYAYQYSLGAAIVALAKALGSLRLPGILGGGRVLGFAADALTKIDNAIRHEFGVGIDALQSAWNEAISYTAQAIHWVGKEIASISHDAAQAIEGLHVQSVTNVYKRVNPGLAARVGALAGLVAALTARVAHIAERKVDVVTHKVTVVEHAIAVPDVGAIPRAIPRVGQLEREIAADLARIRDLSKRFGATAAIGTVAFVLAKLGITWARCSRVNKVGKRICGLNDGLLNALLADSLLIAGAISIRTLAHAALAAEDEIVAGVKRSVSELRPVSPTAEGGYSGTADGRT